jgi:putative transcriptional regulator
MRKRTFLNRIAISWPKASKSWWQVGEGAMGKAYTEINAGLEDALSHAKGKKSKAKEHRIEPIDVRSIREKTGMSQQRFCATFGISIGTLRHWEQGLRSPRGAARVLLKVVDQNPKAVIKAIEQ